MTARCNPGDLAIIANDVPSCTANIGRVVEVSGPSAFNRRGQLTWLIRPVSLEPYMLNNFKDEFMQFMALDDNDIEHPDEWMVPIRPENENIDTEEELELVEK